MFSFAGPSYCRLPVLEAAPNKVPESPAVKAANKDCPVTSSNEEPKETAAELSKPEPIDIDVEGVLSPGLNECTTPLDRILATSELSKRILDSLPFRDILQCSLVSQLWFKRTRHYLRTSTSSSLTLEMDQEPLVPYLKRFSGVMKNRKVFPVSTLRISMGHGPHNCSPRVRHYSELFGLERDLSGMPELNVPRLTVTDSTSFHPSSCEIFQLIKQIIEVVSPTEVRHMEAGVQYFSQLLTKVQSDSRGVKPARMNNLEVFVSVTDTLCRPLDLELIKIQELGSIEGISGLRAFYCPIYSHQLKHIHKGTMLKILKYCHFFGHTRLEDLERLAKERPELISLVLYGVGSPLSLVEFVDKTKLGMIQVLKDLLRCSSETLVEIRTNLPILNAISQNCSSELLHLKILDLHYDISELDIVSNIDFNRIFPRLLTVFFRAHYSHATHALVPDIFYDTEFLELVPSLTVQNLIVQLNMVGNTNEAVDEFPPLHLQLLAKAFPGVENFSLLNHLGLYMSKKLRFYTTLKALMGLGWHELKRLELVTGILFKDLEPLFIGVTAEELVFWKQRGLSSKFKDLQFPPSFYSLQNFKKLKIFKFTCFSIDGGERMTPRVSRSDDGLQSFVYGLEHSSKRFTEYDESWGRACSRFRPSVRSYSQTLTGTSLRDCGLLSRIPNLEFRYDCH